MDYGGPAYHALLTGQSVANSRRHDTYEVEQGVLPMDDGSDFGVGVSIDATPKWVAGIGLASLVTLALLKMAGIRFSFGVGAGK